MAKIFNEKDFFENPDRFFGLLNDEDHNEVNPNSLIFVSPVEMYLMFYEIIKNGSYKTFILPDGYISIIDMQTANVVVTVFNALSPEVREKVIPHFETGAGLEKIVTKAWKCVG